MDRRAFLKTNAQAAAAGAALGLCSATVSAAPQPTDKAAAVASEAPAILVRFTADDHRRRLLNIAKGTRTIQPPRLPKLGNSPHARCGS